MEGYSQLDIQYSKQYGGYMTHEFTVELKCQQEWSWVVAIDLFLSGLGAGLFLLYQTLGLPNSMAVFSIALVAIGGLILLAELGHPLRAWRVISKPLSSWISRGVLFVIVFLLSGSLYLISTVNSLSWLPWGQATFVATSLWAVAGLSALLVAFYPGLVLSASPSIPFWNSPGLSLLYFCQSLLGAGGIVLLLSPFGLFASRPQWVNSVMTFLIVVNFVLIVVYFAVLAGSNVSAKESVRLLTGGLLGWTFWGGVVLFGMIIPLTVVLWIPPATPVAGAFILMGGLLFRYCVLKAGVYVPFPLT